MAKVHLCVVAIAGLLIAPAVLAEQKPCTGLANTEPMIVKLDPKAVYVRDGDTIEERRNCVGLRFSDVDTPELEAPCAPAKDLALGAACKLTGLIRKARVLEFHYDGGDGGHGRKLGKLMIDGKSAGETLKSEGLGCRYSREMEHDWCVTPPKCDARPKHPD